MARRVILGAVATSFLAVGFATAQTPSDAHNGSMSADQSTVVGCVASTPDGFLLKLMAPNAPHRWGGSNSAKASTPVSNGQNPTPQRETRGANSAKASTPLAAATSGAIGPRTGGVTTAKGSVPIMNRTPPEIMYALDADPAQLSVHSDHLVEIRGAIVPAGSSPSVRKLKVEQVKMLAPSCTQ